MLKTYNPLSRRLLLVPYKIASLRHTVPVISIIALNLGLAALWGLSLLLHAGGVTFLSPLVGFLVLLAPGFCLALTIEQLSESKTQPIIFFLWTIILTGLITPAAVFGLSQVLYARPPIADPITPLLGWWGLCFGLAIVVGLIKRQPTVITHLSLEPSTRRELRYLAGGSVLILLINFMLYPLLPEADGYAYLVKWEDIVARPELLAAETRSLFLIFVNLTGQLLKVDPYWVLKAVLPLTHITIVLSCYLFARRFVQESRYRTLLGLTPFFFPVVLQEILISRPQSLFLIAFLPSVVIISEILFDRSNVRQVYWLLALMAVGIIGLKIHALFALIALTGFVSVVAFLWGEIRKRPLDALIITLGLFVLLYPSLAATRILSDAWHIIKLFAITFRNSSFDPWFIDYYRNVDGIEAGWPGVLSLFYYGYNLGLAFPLLLLALFFRKQVGAVRQLAKAPYWALIFFLVFFMFIAEIAPRFQMAYLPDRAWLFLALVFSLVLAPMVGVLTKQGGPRFATFLIIISLASVLVGTSLTYAKQGWVTRDEVKAAEFIRTKTPTDALFLGQGSTRVMVRYYGKREFVRPKKEAIFLDGDKRELDAYLREQEISYQEALNAAPKQRMLLGEKLEEVTREIVRAEATNPQIATYLESLNIMINQTENYLTRPEELVRAYPTIGHPLYLVYNQDKFGSLYGGRSWWRASNFYGANTTKLTENYPLVYDQDGILIWEVRNNSPQP